MKLTLILITTVLFSIGCSKTEEQLKAKLETASIKVESAQCGSCASTIKKALKAVDGVHEAEVNIDKKVATVKFVAAKADLSQLETAIRNAGYSANDKKADAAAYEKLDECCRVE